MTVPQIKASYFQANLAALAVVGPRRGEVEALLKDEIDAARMASRADWLPMAFDQKLSRVVEELCGRDAVIAANRVAFLAAADGPLMRPIVQGAFRVFGVTPKGIIRMVHTGWDAGARDAGTMSVDFDDATATLHHRGMSAEPSWYAGFVGVLEGVLELTGFDGTAEMRIDVDGHPIYTCRWTTRKSAP